MDVSRTENESIQWPQSCPCRFLLKTAVVADEGNVDTMKVLLTKLLGLRKSLKDQDNQQLLLSQR